jgi:hypothetical protein
MLIINCINTFPIISNCVLTLKFLRKQTHQKKRDRLRHGTKTR